MANTVEISVRSKLLQIADDLAKIAKASKQTAEALDDVGKKSGDETRAAVKRTETTLGKLRTMAATVAKNIKDDFKAMMSVAGVVEGMKLSNVFRNNIAQSVALADTIRKLSSVFGIAESRFVSFQEKMTKGLGEIGLSSESASNALKGLGETQVRGEESLLEYSKAAGQLASVTGERGKEGAIAKGMAQVLTARGLDPSDVNEMRVVADSLRRAFNSVGKAPTELLQALESLTEKMPEDLRKKIGTKGLVNLATISAVAGPGSTKFLEEYLSKSATGRLPLEARKFQDVFGPKGLDIAKFRKASKEVFGAIPQDKRLAAQTLGLSEEAAEGFVRLNEALDRVGEAQEKITNDNKTLERQYYSSMTASEAFEASLNKVKASMATPMSAVYKVLTDVLREASQTTEGAAAVTVGAGLLATMLGGGGLRSLFSMARGGVQAAGFEAVTGQKVIPVNVVNAGEIGAGFTGPMIGILTKLGLLAAVGTAAYEGTKYAMDPQSSLVQWQNENIPGFAKANQAIESFVQSVEQFTIDLFTPKSQGFNPKMPEEMPGGLFEPQGGAFAPQSLRSPGVPGVSVQQSAKHPPQKVDVRVQIDSKAKDIKATVLPNRGSAQ